MAFRLQLDPTPEAPARARELVRDLAPAVRPEVLKDLQLVVSELVTNSVKYGPGRPVEVRLEVRGRDAVDGEVVDQGERGAVRIREQDLEREGGLGLHLVDRIAHRWGVHEGSTHVWFELRR